MNFIKTFLAALLAFVVANILIGVFTMMIFAMIVASFGGGVSAPTVRQNSILYISLNNGIADSPPSSPFVSGGFSGGISIDDSNTILQAVAAIERASWDNNIKGIYIDITYGGGISLANIEELRAALLKFKSDSDKFIVSYSDSYSPVGYYLSSVADRVYLNPLGDLDWRGLASTTVFYKGLLDKLEIRPEIVRHGEFKSAVEPFILDRMSNESRQQVSTVLRTIWNNILDDISQSRGIEPEVLSAYASDLTINSSEMALASGMIDGILYQDEVMDVLGRLVAGYEIVSGATDEGRLFDDPEFGQAQYMSDGEAGAETAEDAGRQAEDKISIESADITNVAEADDADAYFEEVRKTSHAPTPTMIELSDYIRVAEASPYGKLSRNKIAVIYADGDIVDGESSGGSIGGKTIASKLAAARDDKNVKAVVLRVNSPGGSALASEVIWREMELVREQMPVIVSMGGMAASGGYYISCPADVIITDRSTITGSIGVFGVLFDVSEAMRKKLGITVDVVKTNPSADFGSPFRAVSPYERRFLQKQVEDVYSVFLGHVADGRNMTTEQVDAIGEGRVWSGVNAVENGLADGFGGIYDAIELAADRADVAGDYHVWQVVDDPNNLTAIMRSLLSSEEVGLRSELGEAWHHYKTVMNLLSTEGPQARMPYRLEIR